MQPEVSVIIPCYHVEQYLDNLFNDLKKQSFKDYEAIFINDGSGDFLSEKIHSFARNDCRFIAIDKENGGVSTARNLGVKVARGKYLVFVDPDDRLGPEYLKSLYDSISKSKSVLGIAGFNQFYVRKNLSIDYSLKLEGVDIPISKAYDYFPPFNVPWNKIVEADFLKKNNLMFPEGITYLEDEHFCLNIYNKIDTVCLIKNCGYTYMMNGSNSALGRYHNNLKLNMSISSNLRSQLYKKIGVSSEVILQENISKVASEIYILIINLFKKGSPLKFKECVAYVKDEILGDSRLMSLFKKHKWKNDKTVVKICNALVHFHSPIIISVFFLIVFKVKYILSK